jgi:putative hydrolase of the HAD superfamily
MIDVDGVIVNGRPSDGRRWDAELLADLGLNAAVLEKAFFEPHWERIVTGEVAMRECLTNILAEIAPNVTAETLISYWFYNDSRLNRSLLQELTQARAKGLRIYLTTNQEHERVSYLTETLGLSGYIDGCQYSAAVGHRKPGLEFFRTVASRVAIQPDELLLVDDAEENVRAAIVAGWRAEHWTPNCELRGILSNRLKTTSSWPAADERLHSLATQIVNSFDGCFRPKPTSNAVSRAEQQNEA